MYPAIGGAELLVRSEKTLTRLMTRFIVGIAGQTDSPRCSERSDQSESIGEWMPSVVCHSDAWTVGEMALRKSRIEADDGRGLRRRLSINARRNAVEQPDP
jgi:hypothetical protein